MHRATALLLLLAAAPAGAQTLRPDDSSPGLLGFGNAVALSQGVAFVGRPGMVAGFPMPAMEKGSIHLFREQGGSWREVGQVAGQDVAVGDGFGAALAVSGSILAVGAPSANQGRGVVYVFERDASGAWIQKVKIQAADGAAGDGFGVVLALRGGLLAVAAPGRDSSRGEVRLFRRNAQTGAWTEQGKLAASPATGDRFGSALVVDSARIVVGAPGSLPSGFGAAAPPRTGYALVYRAGAAGRWQEEGRLTVTGDSTVLGLGNAVLIDGQEILVGGPMSGRATGAVIRFRRDPAGWREAGRIAMGNPERPAFFGRSLARHGTDLLIGAPLASQQAGAVLVFTRDAAGEWKEAQRLTVPSVGFGSGFGTVVAPGDGLVLVGGPSADFFEGAGYLYRHDATARQWRLASTLTGDAARLPAVAGGEVKCTDGTARGFSCTEADLVSFVPVTALGAKRGIMLNDIWGWTHAGSGREFALVGRLDGTAFVEVTDPANPVYLGELPLHTGARPNLWRDIKVYKDHAFIVSDGAGPHGMQVFDLTQLLRVAAPPATFSETAHYDRIHSAHNIVIDTTSGFAYTVGNSMGGETCGGALHMIDIRNPAQPAFAGCFADPATGRARTGYTHDAQCAVYHGPDTAYAGRQICFNASETALGIADVTDKAAPKAISSASYPNVGYSHQGWL
ncbi:MAG TPA: choice-of-anchor B family protein, partial [Gemmatimonadales bacterium]|nr:choice-of-anchor B family protein [Gemmatimonadales bacterium]